MVCYDKWEPIAIARDFISMQCYIAYDVKDMLKLTVLLTVPTVFK